MIKKDYLFVKSSIRNVNKYDKVVTEVTQKLSPFTMDKDSRKPKHDSLSANGRDSIPVPIKFKNKFGTNQGEKLIYSTVE